MPKTFSTAVKLSQGIQLAEFHKVGKRERKALTRTPANIGFSRARLVKRQSQAQSTINNPERRAIELSGKPAAIAQSNDIRAFRKELALATHSVSERRKNEDSIARQEWERMFKG